MLRLYYFSQAKYATSNIVSKRLKVSRISQLNDPFEFAGQDMSDPEWRAVFDDTKAEIDKSIGMICFSRTWQDPVQWGHYGESHKGICCGFDVDPGVVAQVRYIRSRMPLAIESLEEFIDPKNRHIAFHSVLPILTTKFAHWSYEDEFRMWIKLDHEATIQEGELHFAPFSSVLNLREVIVGANSAITPEQLATTLSDYGDEVEVIKARPARNTFSIERQDDVSVWKYPPSLEDLRKSGSECT